MLKHDVIPKHEFVSKFIKNLLLTDYNFFYIYQNKKFAAIEENTDKIYACFEAGGHDMKKLEA